jgi:3-hydroxybutyryl-CoA dehydrogenase
MRIKNITVIGAGTMGNGIAHVMALNGFSVHFVDSNKAALQKAMQTIEQNLYRQCVKQLITNDQKIAALNNIQSFDEVSAAVKDCDLVIEAVTENEDVKINLFKQIDQYAPPHCILASNTSSISISTLAEATNRPDKVIGMHFMNPVPVMKLVEIIRGFKTSDATTDAVVALSASLGKVAISCNDYPGFVANRILMPMINEAIESLHTGVAGVAEIDGIMKLGMAHPMGPLQLADFIGLDVCLSILNVMYDGFKNPKYAPCPLLVNMVMAGKLGVKSGEGFYDYSESKKAEKVSKQFIK